MLGDGCHADIGLVIVLADVGHGLQHIFALVPFFQLGQGQGRRALFAPLTGPVHALLQAGDGLLQLPVVKGL